MKRMSASEAGKLYICPGPNEDGGYLGRTQSSCFVQRAIVRRPFVWICTRIQQLDNAAHVSGSDRVNQISGKSRSNQKESNDCRATKNRKTRPPQFHCTSLQTSVTRNHELEWYQDGRQREFRLAKAHSSQSTDRWEFRKIRHLLQVRLGTLELPDLLSSMHGFFDLLVERIGKLPWRKKMTASSAAMMRI